VNNSDYAIGQFRFLVRLLLVHGSLSSYRLSRLIKYSFYKNISFAFVLFFYQFYNGFSGQALVDDISAAAFNVVFTSIPILLFAVLDRPVINFSTLIQYPQVCSASLLPAWTAKLSWDCKGFLSCSQRSVHSHASLC
jgi:phospholipid-transporting ATPase